jgi:putative membrane protein
MQILNKICGRQNVLILAFSSLIIIALWSGYDPLSRSTWTAEFVAIPIGVIIWGLIVGSKGFKHTTTISYLVTAWMLAVHLYGAHYSYINEPWFSWLRDELGLERNNYDRFAHFFQGMAIFLCFREAISKSARVVGGISNFVLSLVCTLGIAAIAELFEWLVVVILTDADSISYLGTQGDIWDTQSDMALAGLGGIFGSVLFGRIQDWQIAGASVNILRKSLRHLAVTGVLILLTLATIFTVVSKISQWSTIKEIKGQTLDNMSNVEKSLSTANQGPWNNYGVSVDGEYYTASVKIPNKIDFVVVLFPGLYSADLTPDFVSKEIDNAVIIVMDYPHTGGREYYRLKKIVYEIRNQRHSLKNISLAARLILRNVSDEFELSDVPTISAGISFGSLVAYQFAALESQVDGIAFALGFTNLQAVTSSALRYEIENSMSRAVLSYLYSMEFSFLSPREWIKDNLDKQILFINASDEQKFRDASLETFASKHSQAKVISLSGKHFDFFKREKIIELNNVINDWIYKMMGIKR